jgi:hypothetical protein
MDKDQAEARVRDIAAFLKDRDEAFVMTDEQTDAERLASAEAILAILSQEGGGDYQARVGAWMRDVFSAGGADLRTRIDRFLEEAFELAQSLDYDPGRILPIRDYVYGRPIGDPKQEMGGVMVTLAALAGAADIDMDEEGERELTRIHLPEVKAKIMAKQASKNALHTPLPTAMAAAIAEGRTFPSSPPASDGQITEAQVDAALVAMDDYRSEMLAAGEIHGEQFRREMVRRCLAGAALRSPAPVSVSVEEIATKLLKAHDAVDGDQVARQLNRLRAALVADRLNVPQAHKGPGWVGAGAEEADRRYA